MPRAPVLFQESRLSVSPASPAQVLNITTSSAKPSTTFGARKRTFDEFVGLDEEDFTRKHIATEASVFFRRHDQSPRSFLWRVLEDGKMLEIQCVDLVHDAKGQGKKESNLTFRISFSDSIIKGGVTFADQEKTDALECYVLTKAGDLYTITLKKELLNSDTVPRNFDANECFQICSPSLFNHRHPYRFVAVSSTELLVSLHDGGFVRLHRQINETGAQWRESIFSEHTWGNTLRGMMSLKRQQTVRYADFDLWPSAIADMVKSPDGKHIWTVNLEHELRVWDARSGKPIAVMDLLGDPVDEESKRNQRYLMSGEQGTLLRTVSLPPPLDMDIDNEISYHLVVHSPKQHEFKFFGVTFVSSPEGDMVRLLNPKSQMQIIPPLSKYLQSNVWHLEEFFIKAGPEWTSTEIWIRARSGTMCSSFRTQLDIIEGESKDGEFSKKWPRLWTVVDEGPGLSGRLAENVDFPGELENTFNSIPTISEKWLDFLFWPGRFSTACLESAVHIYSKARGVQAKSGKGLTGPPLPLKQRLIQAIESKIFLKRQSGEQPNYARYASDIQAQWKAFYSLLSHLHSKRNQSIALAFDPEEELAWSVCADFVAPIYSPSSFDRLSLNEDMIKDGPKDDDDEIIDTIIPDHEAYINCAITRAAKAFRASMSPDFRDRFARAAITSALAYNAGDREAGANRVSAMYETHNFSAEVMDDEFQALSDAAAEFDGLGSLSAETLLSLFERMDEDSDKPRNKDAHKALSRFGDRLVIDMVEAWHEKHRGIILDVLNLVVFMIGDLDQADLHEDFVAGVGEVFEAAMTRLKHTELLLWLIGNIVPQPQKGITKTSSEEGTDASKDVIQIPLLLRLFIGGWKATSSERRADTLPFQFTVWTKDWIRELQLSKQWDDLTAYVFSFLIRHEFYTLATDFMKFLSTGEDSTSWLCYLEGRHALATGELASSSLRFRAAADGMSTVRGITGLDRAHLLGGEEQLYFGCGACRYFQHVAALYESQRSYSYVADFCNMALEYTDEDDVDFRSSLADIDRRKANKDSPVANKIDDTMEEIKILKRRDDAERAIRHRLFNALIQTCRFKDAWQCVVHLGETRKSNLGIWVKKVVEANAVEMLLGVSAEESGAILLQELDVILLGLAKKSISSRSGAPYHQILYAFRTQRSDFRGAAEILYEYLERIRGQPGHLQDPEDETLLRVYVLLINTLACCGEEDAWLLAEPADPKAGKRKLVTLLDLRQEYTSELDRRSDVLMGRFPLVAAEDEMDVL